MVKLEKGNNLRIRCSTTVFDPVYKTNRSPHRKWHNIEIPNKDLKGNVYSELVKAKGGSWPIRRNKRIFIEP